MIDVVNALITPSTLLRWWTRMEVGPGRCQEMEKALKRKYLIKGERKLLISLGVREYF